ncbi:hypothetical protein GCM10009839_62100 [Catenulispora yoronensis]|uniref:DUF742 domain-containing protein n=1 Tax=Catenulispora yoronensis TaxID=450799 RepID=A0ABP5GM94_9ACTN
MHRAGTRRGSQDPGSLPPGLGQAVFQPPVVASPGAENLRSRPAAPRPTSDADAEPLTRTYVITQGRSGSGPRRRFDLVTLVVAVVPPDAAAAPPWRAGSPGCPPGASPGFPAGRDAVPRPALLPEHRAILDLCRRPLSVAEIAAHLALPFSAATVLIGDLVDAGLAAERRPARAASVDAALLQEVINGLQRL